MALVPLHRLAAIQFRIDDFPDKRYTGRYSHEMASEPPVRWGFGIVAPVKAASEVSMPRRSRSDNCMPVDAFQ